MTREFGVDGFSAEIRLRWTSESGEIVSPGEDINDVQERVSSQIDDCRDEVMRRAEARPGSLRSTRSLRVLLVENEALLSLDLESIVEYGGHEVVGSAATAGSALRLAQEKRHESHLMDINLGGPVDGISAALQICTFLGAQIIFMTGYLE